VGLPGGDNISPPALPVTVVDDIEVKPRSINSSTPWLLSPDAKSVSGKTRAVYASLKITERARPLMMPQPPQDLALRRAA
jgi:hypothetical protein